ncbi:GDSL ESTERASE/LIPASE EXL3 [Salix purpurea]|uniref:GDSL ESTERASE/LIPASE EXL3 n=1 Tax=Salix purpurea TaxID=77065 RepID=A0A9Q0WH15_SALPP|nr:GDSL ESTERASE/LIPASE EXL3 [Salix purpurea]
MKGVAFIKDLDSYWIEILISRLLEKDKKLCGLRDHADHPLPSKHASSASSIPHYSCRYMFSVAYTLFLPSGEILAGSITGKGAFCSLQIFFLQKMLQIEFHNPFNLSSSVQSLQSAVLETRVLILAVTTAFQRLRRATFLRRSTGNVQQRKSNGRLATDFVAEAFGYTKIILAFLDPNLKPADLPHGVSFASAASGYGEAL